MIRLNDDEIFELSCKAGMGGNQASIDFANAIQDALAEKNKGAAVVSSQPDRVAELEALLIWALYHHQGSGSPVGQPIRHALGIDQHAQLTDEQIERAKLAASKGDA